MAQKGKIKNNKDMPFWVVEFKDCDGHFSDGDGFMWGCKSKKEAEASVDRLYKNGYKGVAFVQPKPKKTEGGHE